MWITNFYDEENLEKQFHLRPVDGLLHPMEVIGCKEVEKHYLSKQRVKEVVEQHRYAKNPVDEILEKLGL